MARTDVEFNAEGTILRGWLYRPEGSEDEIVPGVVMAHGYSAVKEMYLDAFAEVFAQAGLAALPTPDSWQWFTETGRTRAPARRNETTLRTVEMLMEYEPGAYIDRIAPHPAVHGGGRPRPPHPG